MNPEGRQQALTLACPVPSAAREALRAELAELNAPLRRALGTLPMLHFARFLVLPGAEAELLLEVGFDGLLGPFLAALWTGAGNELRRVFAHCEPAEALDDAASFQRFATRHAVRAEAAHTAYDELSVAVIRNDAALDRLLQAELDRAQPGEALVNHGPFEIASALQAHARAVPGTWLGSVSRRAPSTEDRLEPVRTRLFEVLLAAVLVPLLELWHWRPSLLRARRQAPSENELGPALRTGGAIAHVAALKPGRWRLSLLRLLLWLAHAWFSQRAANGHALQHVHHWRWLLRPGRLVLLARADLSPATLVGRRSGWERFVSSLIFLQTVGFPLGIAAVLMASRREAALLGWLNGTLRVSEFWFSAYPSLTVTEIERNHRLRELLCRELDEKRAGELCALL